MLALNVLDYLFWKEGDPKDKDFVFRYRNSIEHFYPQEERRVTEAEWKENEKELLKNSIGNLYLTTVNENSELSYNQPSVKVHLLRGENGEEHVSPNETPKQRRMYDMSPWTEKNCKDHADNCWELLAKFLGVPLPTGSSSTSATSKDDPDTPSTGEGGNAGGDVVLTESDQSSN